MCCGKTRQSMGGATIQNRSRLGPGIVPRPMNSKPPSPVPRLASIIPMRTLRFEYTGRSALSVFSPTTGRSYRFDRPGARMEADARDRMLLASVPGLRQIV